MKQIVVLILCSTLLSAQPFYFKKGLGFAARTTNDTEIMKNLNIDWNYNWTASSYSNNPAEFNFVPMIARATSDNIDSVLAKVLVERAKDPGIIHLLGYNEPDHTDQADMTVEEALRFWPRLMDTGLRLGAPVPALIPTRGWGSNFMREASLSNYRVDFMTFHWYGNCSVSSLSNDLVSIHNMYNLPIWITEFAPADWSSHTPASNRWTTNQVAAFMRQVLPTLDALPFVEKYAWFPFPQDSAVGTSSSLFDSNGNLTAIGKIYSDHVSAPFPVVTGLPKSFTTNRPFAIHLDVNRNYGWVATHTPGNWRSFPDTGTNIFVSNTTTVYVRGYTNSGRTSPTNMATYTFKYNAPVVSGAPNSFTTNRSFSLALRVDEDGGYVSTDGIGGAYFRFSAPGTNILIASSKVLSVYGRDAIGNTSRTNVFSYTILADSAISTMALENAWARDLTSATALGSPYREGSKGISFVNITSNTKVSIYTLSGKFVAEATKDPYTSSYSLYWSVTRPGGPRIPPGTYICRLRDPMIESKILKVSVLP